MSSERPGESHSSDTTDDGLDPDLLVRRSDEDITLFDSQRIVDALLRETSIDKEVAAQIGSEVRQFIQRFGFRTLSSSLIRGLVDAKLLELGLEDAHRSHTRLGLPFYDVDRLMHSSSAEPVSNPCGPEGTSLMMAEAIKREYSILNVFSEQVANAHLVGDIHIHRIGAIDRPHSITSSVDYVKKFGVNLPRGFASSAPARHPEVLVAHLVKLSAALQGYLSGPVIWDSLNYSFAPFVVGLSDDSIKQLAQMLLFELSAPAVARGGQVVLVDLNLDLEPPAYLKERVAIGPGGDPTGKTYDEYRQESHRLLQALFEVCLAGDADERAFLTPRSVLHLTPEYRQSAEHAALLDLACRLAVERGGLTISFQREPELAFYHRYGVWENKTVAETETHAFRSLQFQSVYLNLPRVGYLAGGDQVKVFEELSRLMEIAAQAHLEKRVFLEKLLALGERGPLSVLTTRAAGLPFLRLNWTTHAICVIGLSELCRAVFGSDLHESQNATEFSLKVLNHLRHECERLSSKHRVRFVLSGQPAKSPAQRFARLDLRFFGPMASGVVSGDAASESAYYTAGARLSPNSELVILDRIRAEAALHVMGFTNVATEIWLGKSGMGPDDLLQLINEAFEYSDSAGLVFCPEFTVCFDCSKQERGLLEGCPACGSGKVDGLAYDGDRYGYTSTWDSGRLSELRDRRRV